MTWENRIIGTGTEAPDQLLANPMNWRIHPRNQQQALGSVLDEVGWVQNIIVNKRTGHVVDGHMRVAVAISNEAAEVPVVYVDLDEREEKLILASLDPIGSMAVTDSEMMTELLSDLQDQGGVDDLLAELTEKYNPADTMIDTGAPRRPVYTNEEITQAAFDYFREVGFPYRNVPKFIAMQTMNRMAMMDDPPRRHTSSGTDIADTYHPQRWHAASDGGRSPFDAFNTDKYLTLTLNLHHKWGVAITAGYPSILNLTGKAKTVFNFRAGLASYFYRKYCPDGGTVLDSSAGYGGRLIGAMVSTVVSNYIGIDPDTKSHAGNTKIIDEYAPGDFRATLINQPAEEVDMSPYFETVDFALTSPPYFTKEHYSEEPTQSMNKFPDPQDWRDGFLVPFLAKQFEALKPGAINAINITDVNVKEGALPLVEWTKEAAMLAGFEFFGTENVPYAKRPVPQLADKNVVEDEAVPAENLLLFRKPE